jgi:arsenite methyltransferase
MTQTLVTPPVDLDVLRQAIQDEYAFVAQEPEHGFHFFVGRPLARLLGYGDAWLDGVPEASIASFAGTGNPFSLGVLRSGERMVDVGSGGGIDSLIAANMVGPSGRVIGVDMTPARLEAVPRPRACAMSNSVRASASPSRSMTVGRTS